MIKISIFYGLLVATAIATILFVNPSDLWQILLVKIVCGSLIGTLTAIWCDFYKTHRDLKEGLKRLMRQQREISGVTEVLGKFNDK